MTQTNNLISDLIVIDTNIFKGMVAEPKGQIYCLLLRLFEGEVKLLTDEEGRVCSEYELVVGEEDSPVYDIPQVRTLLGYWFDSKNQCPKSVTQKSSLMKRIKKILPVKATKDAIFVYLALDNKKILITNDRKDIIDERKGKGERRSKLLKLSKKSGIMDSKEAYNAL